MNSMCFYWLLGFVLDVVTPQVVSTDHQIVIESTCSSLLPRVGNSIAGTGCCTTVVSFFSLPLSAFTPPKSVSICQEILAIANTNLYLLHLHTGTAH